MCTCVESVLLLKDKSYGPVRTFYPHSFLQAPFHRGKQLRQAGKRRLAPRAAEEKQVPKPATGTCTQPGRQRRHFLLHPTRHISEHHLLISSREPGVLPPGTPAQQGSHILLGFFQVYHVLHSPMTSTSSPQSLSRLTVYQSPRSLRVICYFTTEFTPFAVSDLLFTSLRLPSSFFKNYLLIHCHWDPFPPVS